MSVVPFLTALARKGAAKTVMAAIQSPQLARSVAQRVVKWAQSVELGVEHNTANLDLYKSKDHYLLVDPETGETLLTLRIVDDQDKPTQDEKTENPC